MSNVLVIHPNDRSTDFLKLVYKDKNYDIINSCEILGDELKEIIKKYDKIIMVGHGTSMGLLNPKKGGYIIDNSFADLLRTKETISIWCFSNMYFERNDIIGFHTGMIISEVVEELYMLGHCPLDKKEILKNMEFMSNCFNKCIDKSPEEIKEYMLKHYVGNDEVTQFNRKNMIVI